MSWEGYSQNLCEQGHYWKDYADGYNIPEPDCPICHLQITETNIVDQTNGCYPEPDGCKCACGKKQLIQLSPSIPHCNNPCCGQVKEHPTFKFGERERHGS